MARRKSNGLEWVERATTSSSQDHWRIGAALQTASWKSLASIVGTSTYQYTLLYRLKLHALVLWVAMYEGPACPHADCRNDKNITLSRVFRICPMHGSG
ncbi:hypothetical protein PHMEG_00031878 [Phytophthora megakarya]|uniref:Uncharacterized protein n=1 Tax=Phytophthora megakarya TaxID=4795 RepID=A0A225UX13_9STRA|nr:hypothetical protein PHMEG_00031878 [Phytophthora megakarya]